MQNKVATNMAGEKYSVQNAIVNLPQVGCAMRTLQKPGWHCMRMYKEKMTEEHKAVVQKGIDARIKKALKNFKHLHLLLFGSVASGNASKESDLDIAVDAGHPLTAYERITLINALANETGRPVDLIDLSVAGEPLLGQVLRHGRSILGTDTLFGELISRHVFDQADFMPYRARLLAERRMAWIGK